MEALGLILTLLLDTPTDAFCILSRTYAAGLYPDCNTRLSSQCSLCVPSAGRCMTRISTPSRTASRNRRVSVLARAHQAIDRAAESRDQCQARFSGICGEQCSSATALLFPLTIPSAPNLPCSPVSFQACSLLLLVHRKPFSV